MKAGQQRKRYGDSLPFVLLGYGVITVLLKIWRHNLAIGLNQIASILFPYLIVAAVCFLLRRWMKNKPGFALILALLISIFFYFNIVHGFLFGVFWINKLSWNLGIHPKLLTGSILFLILLILIILMNRVWDGLIWLEECVLVFVLVFQIFTLIKLARFESQSLILQHGFPSVRLKAIANRPDIFHIVIDCYTSSTSLKRHWNFNNRTFTDGLQQKGFFVADSSCSNYNFTTWSIASCLNGGLFNIGNDGLLNNHAPELDSLLRSARVPISLRQAGYVPSIYFITAIDSILPQPLFVTNRSLIADLKSNPLALFRGSYSNLYEKMDHSYYNYNINSFNFLDSLADLKANPSSPRFVFTHNLTLHQPFVVSGSGNFRKYPGSLADRKYYLEAISYVNIRLNKVIEKLLARKPQPVIIIQGDHGSHLQDMRESGTILNAYYFPDRDYRYLYSSITPVNSYRVVFNKYFSTSERLLPDRSTTFYYDQLR